MLPNDRKAIVSTFKLGLISFSGHKLLSILRINVNELLFTILLEKQDIKLERFDKETNHQET